MARRGHVPASLCRALKEIDACTTSSFFTTATATVMFPPLAEAESFSAMRYLQQFAPSLPPREVRLTVLGCAGLFPFQRYSALLEGEIIPGRAIRQEKPRQETVIRRPNLVSSSASSVNRLSFSDFSTTSSNQSTWSWTTQDAEPFDVHQHPNINQSHTPSGPYPAEDPSIGLGLGLDQQPIHNSSNPSFSSGTRGESVVDSTSLTFLTTPLASTFFFAKSSEC